MNDIVHVGVSKGGSPLVTRQCRRELQATSCLPEPYGGSVECYCQTDYCNGDRDVDAATGLATVNSADLLVMMIAAVCGSSTQCDLSY